MKTWIAATSLAVAVATNAAVVDAGTTHDASASIGARARPNLIVPLKTKAFLVPFSTIAATVRFKDNGSTLLVMGRGSGFNPGLSYTSFFYGIGSVPTGSLACFPPTPNLLTAAQMITAYWLPVSGTTRTLYVQKTGLSYVPLTQVATFSVRYDSTPTLPLTTNLNPGRYWLNSCGAIL